ncbi:MAG: hypothetical protein EA348_03260 [Pseudomonadaceae bacterium]|nr:MAG: hypothetical protein EA348_03260 [Pseudomonadaceae bacterium]
MAETDDDAGFTRERLLEALENQLAANEPPAAQATLNKLTLVGYSREDSLDLMAQVLAYSIGVMLDEDKPFDLAAYEQALRNLPELPDALD